MDNKIDKFTNQTCYILIFLILFSSFYVFGLMTDPYQTISNSLEMPEMTTKENVMMQAAPLLELVIGSIAMMIYTLIKRSKLALYTLIMFSLCSLGTGIIVALLVYPLVGAPIVWIVMHLFLMSIYSYLAIINR